MNNTSLLRRRVAVVVSDAALSHLGVLPGDTLIIEKSQFLSPGDLCLVSLEDGSQAVSSYHQRRRGVVGRVVELIRRL